MVWIYNKREICVFQRCYNALQTERFVSFEMQKRNTINGKILFRKPKPKRCSGIKINNYNPVSLSQATIDKSCGNKHMCVCVCLYVR